MSELKGKLMVSHGKASRRFTNELPQGKLSMGELGGRLPMDHQKEKRSGRRAVEV